MDVSSLRANLDAQVHVYQPSGPYKGTYQQYVIGTSNPKLPAFAACMVHKTAAGGTATWHWLQSERSTNVGPTYHFYKQPSANYITVNIAGNGFLDKTRVEFNSGATDAFDADYDANKFHSDKGQPSIYTHAAGDILWSGINVMGALTQTAVVPMGVEPGADGQFTLTFEGIESFDANTTVLLEDKKLHTMTPITATSVYNFSALQTDSWERFVLHFNVAQVNTGIAAVKGAEVNVFAVANNLIVDFSKANIQTATIDVYNVLGQQVLNDKYTGTGIYSHELNMTSGYAIVKVQMNNGEVITRKLFINNN